MPKRSEAALRIMGGRAGEGTVIAIQGIRIPVSPYGNMQGMVLQCLTEDTEVRAAIRDPQLPEGGESGREPRSGRGLEGHFCCTH